MNREEAIKLANDMAFMASIWVDDEGNEINDLVKFAQLVAAKEREAIYQLVMEAPFKEFDRQEEDFDGEAANAMKAMAFSLTVEIRARGEA